MTSGTNRDSKFSFKNWKVLGSFAALFAVMMFVTIVSQDAVKIRSKGAAGDDRIRIGITSQADTATINIRDSHVALNPIGTLAGQTSELRFMELVANGNNYTGFKAPNSLAQNVIYTLPAADGTANQVLTTNGTGSLSWQTFAPSGPAGGDLTGTYPNPTIAPDAVALGPDTTGIFVATITAGTGVTVGGVGVENANATISIGQNVSPTANVTFNSVTTGTVTNAGNITLDAVNAAGASTVSITNSNATQVANLTVEGSVTAAGITNNGGATIGTAGAETIIIGNGGGDTITIGGAIADVSVTDANWSVTAAGAANFASVTTGTVTNAGNITLDAVNAAGASTVSITNSNATQVANLTVEGSVTAAGITATGVTGTVTAGRLDLSGGTDAVAGDYGLTGWGTSTVTVEAGSGDSRGKITITVPAGATVTANPTVTYTFKDGTFTTAPFAVVSPGPGSGTYGAGEYLAVSTTATTMTITFVGTPDVPATGSLTYIINYQVIK